MTRKYPAVGCPRVEIPLKRQPDRAERRVISKALQRIRYVKEVEFVGGPTIRVDCSEVPSLVAHDSIVAVLKSETSNLIR